MKPIRYLHLGKPTHKLKSLYPLVYPFIPQFEVR